MRAVSLQNTADVPVRVLILENVAREAELTEAALAQADVRFVSRRVGARADFVRELANFGPDIVLAEYVPQFTGLEALRLVRSSRRDLPVILVTRSRGDEVAVECMKAGADDYILKTSLGRLPAAALKALGRRAAEQGRHAAEEAVRRSEEQYRLITESTLDLVCRVDAEANVLYASASFGRVVAGRVEDLVGTTLLSLIHPADVANARSALGRALEQHGPVTVELRFETRGESRRFEAVVSPVRSDGRNPDTLVVVSRDLSLRTPSPEPALVTGH
jgi:PAS domain S-box-containing protein